MFVDIAEKKWENCVQDVFRKNKLGCIRIKMKSRTVISVIVIIIILFLARSIYSDHNSKKIIGACILAQTQTSSIEEAKQICADKFK